jgi:hypothetical protein
VQAQASAQGTPWAEALPRCGRPVPGWPVGQLLQGPGADRQIVQSVAAITRPTHSPTDRIQLSQPRKSSNDFPLATRRWDTFGQPPALQNVSQETDFDTMR